MTLPHTKDFVDADLGRYLRRHSRQPSPVEQALIEATNAVATDLAIMQIKPEQAAILEMLSRTTRAQLALDLGTFTGYSALALARGVGASGRVISCDPSLDWISTARTAWQAEGVDDRIDFRNETAAEVIEALEGESSVLDISFMDADKPNYGAHYERLLTLTKPDGLIVIDNVLWNGDVLDPELPGWAAPIHAANQQIAEDPRVHVLMLPVADGLSIVQKLSES